MFAAKQREERDAGQEGSFFTLTYNEQFAPAAEWFAGRGWTAEATPLPTHLERVGRAIPADDREAGLMVGSISLVSAVKG